MNDWRVVRIVLALAVIFVLGVVTGRVTAPQRPAVVAGPRGAVMTADDFMARFLSEVTLSAEQQQALRPIMERMVVEGQGTLPASRERLAILDRHEAEMRGVLRPDQLPAFQRALDRSRTRFERIASLRERRNGTARTNSP